MFRDATVIPLYRLYFEQSIVCAYKVKLTALGSTHTHTLYMYLSARGVCVYSVAFRIFPVARITCIPCLCNPIAHSSHKSQAKRCMTRERPAACLECVVYVLEFPQQEQPVQRALHHVTGSKLK